MLRKGGRLVRVSTGWMTSKLRKKLRAVSEAVAEVDEL
jgi:hypothetical protein